MRFVGSQRGDVVYECTRADRLLADTIAFASAVSCEGVEEYIALARTDKMAEGIVAASGCSTFQMYVSGGVNFRYAIASTYKGNRGPSPQHRAACHRHLIERWGAIETNGYEADDAVGCEQKQDGSTMIVGIDKDLLQIPGKHFQWAIVRKQVVVKEARHLDVTPLQGLRSFFTQALTGDVSDNIKGVYGIGKVKARNILSECKTEEEMYNVVLSHYGEDIQRFQRNCDLLWIWRELGITYSIRKEIYGEIWKENRL